MLPRERPRADARGARRKSSACRSKKVRTVLKIAKEPCRWRLPSARGGLPRGDSSRGPNEAILPSTPVTVETCARLRRARLPSSRRGRRVSSAVRFGHRKNSDPTRWKRWAKQYRVTRDAHPPRSRRTRYRKLTKPKRSRTLRKLLDSMPQATSRPLPLALTPSDAVAAEILAL